MHACTVEYYPLSEVEDEALYARVAELSQDLHWWSPQGQMTAPVVRSWRFVDGVLEVVFDRKALEVFAAIETERMALQHAGLSMCH